jgi:hypothetical protein
MKVSKENFKSLLPSLKEARANLRGKPLRKFLGQLVLDLGIGGQTLVSNKLGMSRTTLRKGMKELQSGIDSPDKTGNRGRHLIEKINPELVASIIRIADGASQTDPQFKSTRLYTRLSPSSIIKELIKEGYSEQKIPCSRTVHNLLNRSGYKPQKVGKTKPKKN